MESKLLKISKAMNKPSSKIGQSVPGKPGYVYELSPNGNLEAVKANKSSGKDNVVNGRTKMGKDWIDLTTGLPHSDPNSKEPSSIITDKNDMKSIESIGKRIKDRVKKDKQGEVKKAVQEAILDKVGAKNLRSYFDSKSKEENRAPYTSEMNKVHALVDSARAKFDKVKHLLSKHALKESKNAK